MDGDDKNARQRGTERENETDGDEDEYGDEDGYSGPASDRHRQRQRQETEEGNMPNVPTALIRSVFRLIFRLFFLLLNPLHPGAMTHPTACLLSIHARLPISVQSLLSNKACV